jgi:P27 family predicted phage terminase small subunit
MKVGRPSGPEKTGKGKPQVPTWLTAEHKREVKKLIKDGGEDWGVLQTDLVIALAVTRVRLKHAIARVEQDGEYYETDRGVVLHPAQKVMENCCAQICSISTKLGLSVNGAVGKTEKAAKAGKQAADFLTITPRSKKA